MGKQGERDGGGGRRLSGRCARSVDQTDQKTLPPEDIGDSQNTAPPPSSHIIQVLSNASSLVGYSPVDHGNKERIVNNAQAASAAVGGRLHVGNSNRGMLSHRGCRVNAKLSGGLFGPLL